jgi:membrane protease YdiL (CAAX protease family)
MSRTREHEMVHPRPTSHPLRQVTVFLVVAYGLALAIALALPHAGIAPLISILVPLGAAALTIALAVPRGERRAVWATVGLARLGGRGLVAAVAGPAVIVGLSFGVAAAFGVVRFPGPDGGLGADLVRVVLTTVVFAVVFLGEEIGWRGFLLFRLGELTSGRRAALLTGAFHAAFHLPLLLLTTTYQSAGSRWVVVPMVMVTLTLAGVWYGWLRLWSGSIWPVSLSHSAFNNIVETVGGAAIATSPAAMAYVTTETGVATMGTMVVVAAYLLTRRAADFALACPAEAAGPAPAVRPGGEPTAQPA